MSVSSPTLSSSSASSSVEISLVLPCEQTIQNVPLQNNPTTSTSKDNPIDTTPVLNKKKRKQDQMMEVRRCQPPRACKWKENTIPSHTIQFTSKRQKQRVRRLCLVESVTDHFVCSNLIRGQNGFNGLYRESM